jgi:cytochrome c oxidase cbb3-type subunit 2
MAFSIHTSHRAIFLIPAGMYVVLVFVIAILPAHRAQQVAADVPEKTVTESEAWGRRLYREVFNCVPCHTMQIRGDARLRSELDGTIPVLAADARFGLERPTTAEEFAHDVAPTLGTQRTGPDLSSVGRRLPGVMWHFWHLYNPRSVSPGSTMEAYPYLFSTEKPEAEHGVEPMEVDIIDELGVTAPELWATPRAVALVDFLLSLTREKTEEE